MEVVPQKGIRREAGRLRRDGRPAGLAGAELIRSGNAAPQKGARARAGSPGGDREVAGPPPHVLRCRCTQCPWAPCCLLQHQGALLFMGPLTASLLVVHADPRAGRGGARKGPRPEPGTAVRPVTEMTLTGCQPLL